MPLILAVEPDRRQAAQLTGLIRHHVGVELVLADTTEGALTAIGRRVPDLVLVPALLAPQDDAALASALRVIAAAAHVRTLTIPVFDNGVRKTSSRKGMLARLGLGRGESEAPAGCDPTLFAEQVIAYLKEVADERERSEYANRRLAEPPAVQAEPPSEWQAEPEPDHAAEPVPETVPEYVPVYAPDYTPDYTPVYTPEPLAAAAEGLAAAPVEDRLAEEPTAEVPDTDTADADEGENFDLSELLELCVDGEESGTRGDADNEGVDVYSIELSPDELTTDIDETPAFAVTAQLEAMIDTPSPETDGPIDELKAALDDTSLVVVEEPEWDDTSQLIEDQDAGSHMWMPLMRPPAWPALHRSIADTPLAAATIAIMQAAPLPAPVPVSTMVAAAPEPVTASAPAPASGGGDGHDPAWVDLVESLRQDIERRKNAPTPSAEERARVAAAAAAAKPKRRAGKEAQPVQDEWGFFDPEQCGFAALLAKLDEITDTPRAEESSPTRTR